MSAYDAYNLSLRDSTEFSVPTGGGSGESGGDSDFSIATLTIDATSFQSFSSVFGAIGVPYIDEYYGTVASWPMADASSQVYQLPVILHAGKATIIINNSIILALVTSYSGAIALTPQNLFEMTGDATIVLSDQAS